MNAQTWTRRRLLATSLALTALPLFVSASPRESLLPLPAADDQATALGYRPSADSVSDAARVAGSHCGNCQFHQPDGGCPVFPGYRVSPSGWCRAWSAMETAA